LTAILILPLQSNPRSCEWPPKTQYQIGNNRGRINGWVGAQSVFGNCVKVEP
jgi:hypothetical protein